MSDSFSTELNPTQVFRTIIAIGGLWNRHSIAKISGYNPRTVDYWTGRIGKRRERHPHRNRKTQGFPAPVATLPPKQMPLYAGNEVLQWFERTDRFTAAERMTEAINRYKRQSRRENE